MKQRDSWHILCEDGVLTMARRLPVRFDLAVETTLPGGSVRRIAHQVRQDVWRRLRGLRGFAPAVRVAVEDGRLRVTAGGQVDGVVNRAHAEAAIADVLENPAHRARWAR